MNSLVSFFMSSGWPGDAFSGNVGILIPLLKLLLHS